MADVFISYKREDRRVVGQLVRHLRDEGLSVFWDGMIVGGEVWEDRIESELKKAKAVLVCWSPEAIKSTNVKAEAREAHATGRLVSVFLRPTKLPLFFQEHQAIDLSRWRDQKTPEIATTSICRSSTAPASASRISAVKVASPQRRSGKLPTKPILVKRID